MAIVFTPPSLLMHYTTLSVYIQFVCKLDSVNILPAFNKWRRKLERLVCACSVKDHDRQVGEKRQNSSHTRDMNCNWRNDAVQLPRVALNGNSVDDDDDDDEGSNSNSETHSDSASMPYQYLIERDIERERKNLRIAQSLSEKSVVAMSANDSDLSKDACMTEVCQSNGAFEATAREMSTVESCASKSFGDSAISTSTLPNTDETFIYSTPVFEDVEEIDEDIELTMEEDEDIVPEALVNNSYFNDNFKSLSESPSKSYFEGLLMDDVDPNDEKIVPESNFKKISPSSSTCFLTMNGSINSQDSLKLPKIISNEIITNDQMSPALLKALNKSSVEPRRNEISIRNKIEDISRYKNKNNLKIIENEKETNTKNSVKNNIKTNIISIPKENMRLTRSNVKLYAKSMELLCNGSSSKDKNVNTLLTQNLSEQTGNEQFQQNFISKSGMYENRYLNSDDINVKHFKSVAIDGGVDKRVKINTRKLINDLTYGIKIVVERLDLSSIPR